ncbi:hypothetical protein Y032_0017g3414 [Ancylostoma ceylanicum]|uniref:Uncharacterized protein n=1 Tax=Ancylostoma ceylanicum TaxID=53326 RepID=A0A016V6F4_9BILA|nr:hypothetical protein Y032_0017g3414 [Ancylostoma ceylanicum]
MTGSEPSTPCKTVEYLSHLAISVSLEPGTEMKYMLHHHVKQVFKLDSFHSELRVWFLYFPCKQYAVISHAYDQIISWHYLVKVVEHI